jgi:hypothetical protein
MTPILLRILSDPLDFGTRNPREPSNTHEKGKSLRPSQGDSLAAWGAMDSINRFHRGLRYFPEEEGLEKHPRSSHFPAGINSPVFGSM